MTEKTEGLLHRPRLDALFQQALKSPLVTVIAGPGYGKSTAAASFFQAHPYRLIWKRLARLDNLPYHFWQTLLPSFSGILSQKAIDRLNVLGFPDTPAKIDHFLHTLQTHILDKELCVFVVDDYDLIDNAHVRYFFEALVEARLDNFRLVILSSAHTDIGVIGLRSGGVYEITKEPLCFTAEEAKCLFEMNGVPIDDVLLQKVLHDTGGWPLAVYLAARQVSAAPQEGYTATGGRPQIVNQMFEREFFLNYSTDMQALLIKLSMLRGFSPELLSRFGIENVETTVETIRNNMFISPEQGSGLFSMQPMYREFLAGQSYKIDAREWARIYEIAGDYYLEFDYILEATECFGQSRAYEKLLSCIIALAYRRMSLGMAPAKYLSQKLDLFPDDFVQEHPVIKLLRANILFSSLELEQCYDQLLALAESLHAADREQDRYVLGDVYTYLGAIRLTRCQEDFGVYYKKACEYLPEGTTLRPGNMLILENIHTLSLPDHMPGALSRMETAIHEGVPYMTRALKGAGTGLDHLFSAEAGYNTLELNKAQKHAYQAIYRGAEAEQHDIICNAHIILARIALFQGNYSIMTEQIQNISDYIAEHKIPALYDLQDYAMSWRFLRMNDCEKISPWILNARSHRHDQPQMTIGRDRIVYAEYLLKTNAYAELIAMAEPLIRLYEKRYLFVDRLWLHVLCAIAYMKLGDTERCLSAFNTAYDMAHHNNVIMPFAENASNVRTLIDYIKRNTPPDRYDAAWLDLLQSRASMYAKRLAAVMREYNAQNSPPGKQAGVHLSPRELEVLHSLSQGFTREEIASMQHVSVNTVKSSLRNAYNKLGAVNRADAIRAATSLGLLDDMVDGT